MNEDIIDEARALSKAVATLEARPGRGQANVRQQIHEDALALLVRCHVPPAVTALFSGLLGDVMAKSRDLDNKHQAERAAAMLEARGASRADIARAYAEARRRQGDYGKEVDRLRQQPHYLALVEEYRH